MKLYPKALVALQLSLIFLLVYNSNLRESNYPAQVIFLIGLILGIWSVLVMRKSKFRITPDVADGAKLITNGPFKYVRHPMYSAVLLICLGLLLSNINALSIMFYALLIIDLILKINYEEKSLVSSFSEYMKYMKKTKRIIPFLI